MQQLLREKYDGVKSEAFYADCKRLALGEPLAYLIGWTPFLNTTIFLDSHPLIPRPETEFWTEQAIKLIAAQNTKTSLHILDVCAGSGCIGVAVANAIPQAKVDFSEIDTRHLDTIKKNLQKNGIAKERYAVYHTNLFTDLPTAYDFILANPPYIDASLERAEASVTEYEPYVALFGGEAGLEVIADIVTEARSYLTAHGQLWIEHEPEQSAAIAKLGETEGFRVNTKTDQYNVERYSVLMLQ